MAHAELVWYVVTMWEQLIHVLYFQEHTSCASWEYIPVIVIGRVREPKAEHLGGRGNYKKTQKHCQKKVTNNLHVHDWTYRYSQVLTTGSLIASALYIVIPGSSLTEMKISERSR